MIEANQLRIGNLVYIKFKDFPNPRIHSIEAFEILAIEDEKLSKRGIDILPIPITETILSDNGFNKIIDDKSKVEHWHRGFHLNGISCPPITIWETKTDVGRTSIGHHIMYVHQLQNLFYALTGEELEVNL